jgi:hypothetical protein
MDKVAKAREDFDCIVDLDGFNRSGSGLATTWPNGVLVCRHGSRAAWQRPCSTSVPTPDQQRRLGLAGTAGRTARRLDFFALG